MIRVLFASAVLLFALPLLARDKTDVLVMKNGDRMTCEVKGLNAGVLYVKFDYIDGTTSVDWSKVAKIESKQLFLVKTADGSVYSGTLDTAENETGRPVTIEVMETPGKETELARAQVVELVVTSDKFWQRFSGDVSLGMSYSKGNQATQYNLSSQAVYDRERWKAGASFASNLSSNSGADVSTRNQLELSSARLLRRSNWFYMGFGNFLQSSEQGIALQTTVGAGFGKYLLHTNRSTVTLTGGGAWEGIRYDQSRGQPPTENVAAAYIAGRVNLFRFSKTNFDVTATLLPALSDPGRLHFATNMSYFVKIISDLKWNISFYGSWDNRPPAGFSSSDYGTSSGLTWTFGLK